MKKSALKDAINENLDYVDLITALFNDVPELKTIEFNVENAYDDSNYYDDTTLTAINGYSWNSGEECYDDETEDYDEQSNRPSGEKIKDDDVIRACADLTNRIASSFGYGDHKLIRSRYVNKSNKDKDGLFRDFLYKFAAGQKIEDQNILLKFDPEWALYYAHDHGRLEESIENKIFSKKKDSSHCHTKLAYLYAVHVLKDKLPEKIEKFFILNNLGNKKKKEDYNYHDDENEKYFKKYLEFKESLKRNE